MAPDIVEALLRTIELKDACTAAHTWRVALYARELAIAAGMDEATVERVTLAAAMHDLGKIDVPDRILQKPEPLSKAERRRMQRHPVYGYDRLVRMGEGDPILLELVRHHHERLDGSGYPDGLKGESIPTVARYFAVIDTFDAMTSVRPYRASLPPDAAERSIAELESLVGVHYCEPSVRVFSALFRNRRLDWIMHYFNDRCPLPGYGGPDRLLEMIKTAREHAGNPAA
jgi:HD-GYP domain-containing protein (c-di-GMP phosphodiesterase class II)